jgi:AsmA protein
MEQRMRAALTLGKGSARLQKLDARLYGGTLHATGALSADDGGGSMKLAAQLAAVDLKALLAATGGVQKFEGRLNGSLQLAAQGADPAQWKNTLSGPLQLGIDDAVLRGVSVEEVVCQAAAQLNHEALKASFEPVTRFRGVQAALDFQQGVGTFRQLGATVPNMSMRGEGRIDLPRRKLKVQLDTRVTDDLSGRDPACRMTRKMLAIEWPVTCKGSFDEDPKRWCRIDEDDLAKIATQFATEKVQDKLMKKLGEFLHRD